MHARAAVIPDQFSGLSRASLIALIGTGIIVASVNSSFAANDRGQKNRRLQDLVKAKHLQAMRAGLSGPRTSQIQ
jgi:hypothetical protein